MFGLTERRGTRPSELNDGLELRGECHEQLVRYTIHSGYDPFKMSHPVRGTNQVIHCYCERGFPLFGANQIV